LPVGDHPMALYLKREVIIRGLHNFSVLSAFNFESDTRTVSSVKAVTQSPAHEMERTRVLLEKLC
jgi:hypothetical protein